MIDKSNDIPKFLKDFFPSTSEEKELYREAMTYTGNIPYFNNRRLAIVEDAVIDVILKEYLYRKYVNKREVSLTPLCDQLKKNDILAYIADELELGKYVTNTQKYPNLKELHAGALEALFGAIYLSRDLEKAKELVNRINLIKKAIALINE